MKKAICLAAAVLAVPFVCAQDYQWDDLDTRKINKEDPHAFFVIADSFDAALEPLDVDGVENIYKGKAYGLLNGKWKFYFAESPEQIEDEFFTENFDDSKWADLEVPGTWQTQGYDTISYPNVTHEFFYDKKGNWLKEFNGLDSDTTPDVIKKPFINEIHREAGIYRRNFDLPESWNGMSVFLKFAGVKSGFRLFVNGKFAGYSEDSFLPAEFDVTRLLKPGKNSVAIVVYKYTTGSFFEIQDMPHNMGIFRDVVAVARPATHLSDYYAAAEISADLKSAKLNFEARVKNPGSGSRLDVFIVDSEKKLLGNGPLLSGEITGEKFSASASVEGFKLWSPDKPSLYTIVIRISGSDGGEVETVRADWAFRKFEIRGTETFFNNVSFRFKGVNRHNWSPDKGSAVDFKWLKLDCELIKRANINSVRTSHYPNDEKFYMLCNRYGIAVMDENNHETHNLRRHLPAEDDKFVAPSVERMENMVYRDRNVPCVIVWSLGNESAVYHTKSHKAMELAARKIDPTRPIHSEAGAGQKGNSSDFVSPMYGGMGRMQRYLDGEPPKPFIFCEYSFAIGNAIGNLKDLWDMMRRESSLRGGFIWDWVDRTLYLKREDGKTILADGRDFGTRPSAGTWCASGVVFSDRVLPPKYFEVGRVYQDIQMEPLDPASGLLKFSNEFVSTDLYEFELEIIVERNGREIASQKSTAPALKPGETKELKLGLPKYDSGGEGEYFYTVNIRRKDAAPCSDAGGVLASSQFFIGRVGAPKEIPVRGTVAVSGKDDVVILSAGTARAVFSKNDAAMTEYYSNGKRLMASPLEFDISSAWMDNHGRFKNEAKNLGLESLKCVESSLKTEKQPAGAVRVIASRKLVNEDGDGFVFNTAYTMLGSGAMQVGVDVTKLNDMQEKALLPRVGVRATFEKGFSDVSYFGRGGTHNYNDKHMASPVGLYKLDVEKEIVRYVKPQDCGNREDVRWMKILDRAGDGIAVVAGAPLPMSILPYSQKVLEKTQKPEDLPESTENEFRIAWKVAGVGNGALGPNTLEKYQPLFKGSVGFSFVIMPLKASKEYVDFSSLAFPAKLAFAHKKLEENLKDEKLKPVPAGEWVSKDAVATYSSRSRYSPSRETVLDPAGENYGFHTDREDSRQWMVVDLGKMQNVTGAMIYNRKDAQGDRTDNMIMYVSADGTDWKEVWKTRSARHSWVVKLAHSEKARYVKLLLDKKEYFHLSGVKIYAE